MEAWRLELALRIETKLNRLRRHQWKHGLTSRLRRKQFWKGMEKDPARECPVAPLCLSLPFPACTGFYFHGCICRTRVCLLFSPPFSRPLTAYESLQKRLSIDLLLVNTTLICLSWHSCVRPYCMFNLMMFVVLLVMKPCGGTTIAMAMVRQG